MRAPWGRLALLAGLLLAGPARAERVTLGLLTDMSGVFSDFSGRGSVAAAQLAIEDYRAENPALDVRLLTADHQNKPDVGSAVVQGWIANDGVDAIIDVPNTAIALAISDVARAGNKVLLISGAGASTLTGRQCSPDTVQWTFDSWSLAHALGRTLIAQGGRSWFFLVADYSFGHTLAADMGAEVRRLGGTVSGEVSHPVGATDLSAFLLQAQASGARVLALADAGTDAINAVKSAGEFGLARGGMTIAGLIMFVTDVHAIGLPLAQNMLLATPFYWDEDARTRAFSERFAARMGGARPSMIQAGVYSSTLFYLRTVAASPTPHDGRAVVAAMKAAPPQDDPLFGGGFIRADGRRVHDMLVYRVKTPAQSAGPWDLYDFVRRIPAEEAVRPLSESECPLVRK